MGGPYEIRSFPIEKSSRGNEGIPVFVQDQTTGVLDLPFLRQLNTTSLASDTSIDSRIVSLSPGHSAVIGNVLEIASTVNGSHFFQSEITNVSVNDVTLSSPVGRIFTAAESQVIVSDGNMAVNGSVDNVVFSVNPTPIQSGDMVRIIGTMTNNTDMDFETFGGLTALTNGLELRVVNSDGTYRNLLNFKDNGDIENASYDARYFENNGGGIRGFTARITWGGWDKHGVVIRLDGSLGERLELLVQDNLSGLTSMKWIAQGSEVQS